MIELTTGIAFLLSSMYGTGAITGDTLDVQPLSANLEGNKAQIITAVKGAELEKYLKENFADTPILVEIARCESELRQFDKNGKIIRGKVDNADVGVMQINERYHLENAKKLGYDIYTVEGNVAYAKYLYEKYGSEPWKASSPCWGKTAVAQEALAKK
jgi:hypothetical protein